MDEWRIQQQPQQTQQRMLSGGVGPVLSYHPIRSRSSPYPSPQQMSELKQSYQYQQNSSTTSTNPLSPSTTTATTPNPNQTSTPLSVKNDSNDASSSSTDEISSTTTNPDVYTPNNTNVSYTPVPIEQQRIMPPKSTIGPMVGYHPGQQQIMAARSRSMPYPMPPQGPHHHSHPMYPHSSGPVCQCAQHMHQTNGHYPMHPSQHPMYYHHQQQQQQQHEAWYRYQQQQQQQQAAWRQHQMQQHLQSHPQPVPIEQSYNAILSDTPSTTKLKATKIKAKKKSSNTPLLNEEPTFKYQPVPPSSLNLSVQQYPSQRACIPPQTTAAYYPSVYSTPNPYAPAQQLPPPLSTSMSQDHPMYTQTSPSTLSHHQSQIFTSPLSNPGTPHQILNNGEFTNGTAEFGVPYHHGAPGSVNSLTDALCPGGGDTTDRQMTPGPPSVGTPRVAPHQYSFPQTPSTPQTMNNQNANPHTPVMMPPTPNPLSAPPTPLTRPRSSSEQIPNPYQQYEQNKSMNNVDDLAAYLKDPTNVYLADDVSSTFFDDIDALANTYLGPQTNNHQQTNVDHNSADDILLNFLCSDLTN